MPFDPMQQNITFLGPDGLTPIAVPMTALDAFTDESVRTCFNYGVQTGACLITLAVLAVLTTPSTKLRRLPAALQLTALLLGTARCALLFSQYVASVGHIYPNFADDAAVAFADMPAFTARAVLGNCVGTAFVFAIEAALMNQAWTMVALWHGVVRYVLVGVSAAVALAAAGLSLALCVVQLRDNLRYVSVMDDAWAPQASIVANCVSIFWFCALFNAKLILHLVTHRGLLPPERALSSIEVLVMTNGVLMVVPVIFAGLEWAQIANFESASLTQISVAVILPLGTLAAQRLTVRLNSTARHTRSSPMPDSATTTVTAPTKTVTTTFGSMSTTATLLDRSDSGAGANRATKALDHFDLELQRIDSAATETAEACAHAAAPPLSPGAKQLLDESV